MFLDSYGRTHEIVIWGMIYYMFVFFMLHVSTFQRGSFSQKGFVMIGFSHEFAGKRSVGWYKRRLRPLRFTDMYYTSLLDANIMLMVSSKIC